MTDGKGNGPPPVARSTQGGSPKTLDLGKKPDVTRKPDGIKLPDVAKKPDVTRKPDFVAKPDLSTKPDFTRKPDFARKPELSGSPQRGIGSVPPLDRRTLDAKDAAKLRFADRYKAGDFDRLTKGETANKLRLGEQYKLHQQGDVARRLDLHKGGNKFAGLHNVHDASKVLGPGYRYLHGPVHPHFAHHSFKHNYWGHHWFGATSWYPHWNPWVNWSWHYPLQSVLGSAAVLVPADLTTIRARRGSTGTRRRSSRCR